MNEYLIKIKGTQGLDDDSETIEFSTYGDIEFSEKQTVLTYCEGEMLGVKNVKTKLTVNDGDGIVMERVGEMNSKLIIEKGVRNNCFYSTPQGELVLGIYGDEIKSDLSRDGGSILMSYSIDSNLQPISKNKVEIEVKRAK